MGALCVHEFMSIDGVIDAPTWTREHRARRGQREEAHRAGEEV
jgi:hypothetical protein